MRFTHGHLTNYGVALNDQASSPADAVIRTVERFRQLGFRETQHGVHLFGHVPHVAPQAWLHAIPPGLTEEGIAELSRAIGKEFPVDYVEFLRVMNGVKLFSGALYLYGARPPAGGRGLDSAFLPFDMVDPNGSERPRGLRDDLLVIGGYKVDGSLVTIDSPTGRVERNDRESGARLNTWPSLRAFLGDELERLGHLHDKDGRLMTTRDMLLPRTVH